MSDLRAVFPPEILQLMNMQAQTPQLPQPNPHLAASAAQSSATRDFVKGFINSPGVAQTFGTEMTPSTGSVPAKATPNPTKLLLGGNYTELGAHLAKALGNTGK